MAAADEELEGGTPGIRPFWAGTISFGLVSIPVALFSATRARSTVGMRMLAEDGTPLERRYVCSQEETPLDWDDIVRGYEVKKGKFVVISDDELEAIEPKKSRDIDLRLFVDQDEIDPKYFERGYFLTPTGGSTKAYNLLATVMEKNRRAGVATFVMRTKQYVIAILAENGILRAETLRFADEVRSPADVGLPEVQKPKPAAVTKFTKAITARSKKVDFREFLDDYNERLEKLARSKQKKKEDIIRVEEPESSETEGAEVIDLLQVLQRSLNSGGSSGARRPAKKAGGGRKRAAPAKKR